MSVDRFAGDVFKEVSGTRFDEDDPLRVQIPGATDEQSTLINRIINNDWRDQPMMNYRGRNLDLNELSTSYDAGDNTRSTEGVMIDNLNLPDHMKKGLAKYKTPMSQALPGAQNIRRFKEG